MAKQLSPEEKQQLETVLLRIKDPRNWNTDPDTLMRILQENPSVRGMVYGSVSEHHFVTHLSETLQVIRHHKDDDHKKTKSDRTFVHQDRVFTVQIKSLQTNSIKPLGNGKFKATVQNDASDKRPVTLPNGQTVTTTCYKVGEYDVLAVSLQPFTGKWDYAFKKNTNLRRTEKYDVETNKYLLATLEPIEYPLEPASGWADDLAELLKDEFLGKPVMIETTASGEAIVDDTVDSKGVSIVEKPTD